MIAPNSVPGVQGRKPRNFQGGKGKKERKCHSQKMAAAGKEWKKKRTQSPQDSPSLVTTAFKKKNSESLPPGKKKKGKGRGGDPRKVTA